MTEAKGDESSGNNCKKEGANILSYQALTHKICVDANPSAWLPCIRVE